MDVDMEDVQMTDYDPNKHNEKQNGYANGNAYEEDEGEEPRVQCAHQ